MKQVTTQKWVLSAFLIAALGSQYYYSISSKDISSTDMSSLVEIEDAAKVLEVASGNDPKPATTTTTTDPKKVVQAVSSEADCPDCVTLTRAEAERIRKILKEVVDDKSTTTTTTTPAKANCANEPTTAERLRCERQEREDLKREQAEAKKEKELDERLTRNEEFNDKMEEAVDRCRGDLSCVVSRYNSLLSRYTGRRKIDLVVAQSAYKKYIEAELKTRLNAMDESADSANEIIGALAAGIPMEYRQIKESLVLAIKNSTEARAAAVKETLKNSQIELNNKHPYEAQQLLLQAQREQAELNADVFGNPRAGRVGYFDVLSTELKDNDNSTWAYVQSNLLTPIRNLFSNTTNSTTASGDNNSGSGNRGTRGGAPNSGGTVDNKMSVLNPQNNSGVNFQSPTSTVRGNRGSR